jgi:hypothetical protein
VIRAALAYLGALAVISGCAAIPSASLPPSPAPSAGAERIIVLAGTVGATSLVASEAGSAGNLVPLRASGLPRDAAWLSGDGSTLLVTSLGGAVFQDHGSGGDAWVPAVGDLGVAHPSRAFASLRPFVAAGASVAVAPEVATVEGDPGSGRPGRLVVETLAGIVLRTFTMRSPAESAPCWLPDGRIVLLDRDARDLPQAIVVDPATGRVGFPRGLPVRSLGVAGGLVASVGLDGAVRAGPITRWLAGDSLPIVPGGIDEVALQAQPSPSGGELAVVVADENGDAAAIQILGLADGWHEIARFGLPRGANRAVVSWLAAS